MSAGLRSSRSGVSSANAVNEKGSENNSGVEDNDKSRSSERDSKKTASRSRSRSSADSELHNVVIKTEPLDEDFEGQEDLPETGFDSQTGDRSSITRNKERSRQTYNFNTLDKEELREALSRNENNLKSVSDQNERKAVDRLVDFYHKSMNLPGPFAVSLVDRNHDPSLTIVFHCWICDDEFRDKLGIVRHLKEWHMDVPGIDCIEKKMRVPICLTCGLSGGCEHRSINEDEDDEEDMVRKKTFELRGSEDIIHGKFSCNVCNINFETTYQQRDHFAKVHPNQKMFKCDYCPDSFFQHHKLVVHTRTHTGYKPYACGICGNKFPKNSDLNRHIRTHATKGEKPYQCAQCGQTFTQKCSLEKHARRHADKDGGYPCYHCGLTFVYENDLDAHSKKEHGERTWKCLDCGKLFEERRHLIVHAKTHQQGIKYQCSFCDRTFTKRHQLAKHEDRIHHRQDDLKCKVCQKEFRRRENLTRHMNIHLDRREFQCTQCGMAFTEKGSLKRHVLSRHEQHRPFKCRLCGKAFSRRFLLRKHHLRAHKLFPFEGEENPMPMRGFGAKTVNIDRYIRKKSDTANTSHDGRVSESFAGAGSGTMERNDTAAREMNDSVGSRSGFEEDDAQHDFEESRDEEMGSSHDGFEENENEDEDMSSSSFGVYGESQ